MGFNAEEFFCFMLVCIFYNSIVYNVYKVYDIYIDIVRMQVRKLALGLTSLEFVSNTLFEYACTSAQLFMISW